MYLPTKFEKNLASGFREAENVMAIPMPLIRAQAKCGLMSVA